MALVTTEITNLPAAVSIDGSEKGVLVQGGTTKQFALALVLSGGGSQAANTFLAGPTSGAAANVSFRTIVNADLAASATTNYILTAGASAPVWTNPSALGIDLDIGSTTITGGTTTRILYDNAGVLGEYAQVPLAVGGTNAALVAAVGGIVYSSSTAMAILSGTATAGQHLQSGASAAPSWTTATYPATATGTGAILRADGTNWAATTATYPATAAQGTVLNASGANVLAATATPTLGMAGATLGTLSLAGNTSGVVAIQPQAAAGTFNFNLPTTAGTSGYVLTSGGGGAAPMTWTNPSSLGIDLDVGTTAITNGADTRILYDNAGVLGEYTITGTGTVVAMQTAPTFATSITTPSVLATANDSGAIGASGTAFADLFLASGGVINWNAGNVTLTQSAGLLTLSGGLTVTAQVWSGSVSSALQTLTGASDGFRANSTNVTQFAGESTTTSGSGGGALLGVYSNDGAAMASGDRLGGLRAGGSSSASALRNSAIIAAFAAEAWSDGSAYGSRWEFQTTNNLATSATTKLILGNAGVLAFGATEANTVPALRAASTTLEVRLGDNSDYAPLRASTGTFSSVLASADDSGAIGASGTAFADLFLASGAVMDFAAGNSVITHSSAVLTVSTGDLRVSNNFTNAASVATLGGAQTLTSKSLTSPTITTSPTAAGATWTDLGSVTTVALATVTGAVDMGGATSLEIPNSTAPTVNADGEIAVDTTVTDFAQGVIKYYSTAEMGVVAMPVAEFGSPANGAVPTYNSTTDQFEMDVPAGAGTVTSITPGNGLTSNIAADAPGSAITTTGTLSAACPVNAQTGTTYTMLQGDRAKLVTFSNISSVAVTLPQAGASSEFQLGWFCYVQNKNYGAVTITPATSTIDGAATLVLQRGQGALIVSDDTNYQVCHGYGPKVAIQVFTADGTYTPTTGMTHCIIECVGGGGGGGGTDGDATFVLWAGGGGAGGYSRKVASAADIGASQAVDVGALGAGGSAGNNAGSAGADTSVGSLCIGKGGSGGAATTNGAFGAGGTGGVAGTGDFTPVGASGQSGFYFNYVATAMINSMGKGADSIYGRGGSGSAAVATTASAGSAAGNYGSGGGGGASNATATDAAGGNGSAGVVIITEFMA